MKVSTLKIKTTLNTHTKSKKRLLSIITNDCGDCEAWNQRVLAVIKDSGLNLGKKYKLGTQLQPSHIEPVLYNTEDGSVIELVSTEKYNHVRYKIYTPEFLIKAQLEGRGVDVETNWEELIISKSTPPKDSDGDMNDNDKEEKEFPSLFSELPSLGLESMNKYPLDPSLLTIPLADFKKKDRMKFKRDSESTALSSSLSDEKLKDSFYYNPKNLKWFKHNGKIYFKSDKDRKKFLKAESEIEEKKLLTLLRFEDLKMINEGQLMDDMSLIFENPREVEKFSEEKINELERTYIMALDILVDLHNGFKDITIQKKGGGRDDKSRSKLILKDYPKVENALIRYENIRTMVNERPEVLFEALDQESFQIRHRYLKFITSTIDTNSQKAREYIQFNTDGTSYFDSIQSSLNELIMRNQLDIRVRASNPTPEHKPNLNVNDIGAQETKKSRAKAGENKGVLTSELKAKKVQISAEFLHQILYNSKFVDANARNFTSHKYLTPDFYREIREYFKPEKRDEDLFEYRKTQFYATILRDKGVYVDESSTDYPGLNGDKQISLEMALIMYDITKYIVEKRKTGGPYKPNEDSKKDGLDYYYYVFVEMDKKNLPPEQYLEKLIKAFEDNNIDYK